MRTLKAQTSNIQTILKSDHGFSLIEILVALLLAALILLVVPTSDGPQKHRELKAAIEDMDRSIRFAANESILRNTVVRLRISLEKVPMEYTVEYGPAGNLPLPEVTEKTTLSLAEEKAEQKRSQALDRQFTKVEEFEEIKHEIHPDVTVLGLGSTTQKKLITQGEASIYFYPTGEKDGAILFMATTEEFAYIEVQPFLNETNHLYEPVKSGSVAKLEDLLQTRMDEVFKTWLTR